MSFGSSYRFGLNIFSLFKYYATKHVSVLWSFSMNHFLTNLLYVNFLNNQSYSKHSYNSETNKNPYIIIMFNHIYIQFINQSINQSQDLDLVLTT